PAAWRDDAGVILYTDGPAGEYRFDTPVEWGNIRSLTLYRFTANGWLPAGKIKIKECAFVAALETGTPYYAIPAER
ncbi:MAG: hypothetical protein LBJ01_01700, partial [Tannerella sp.]|nr:hypothetical protein [Tannerella sp.]